jgi:uncharacterized alpha-E superfamily protein
MLSRVAERVYWLGRYMERCENTARLVNVNSILNVIRNRRMKKLLSILFLWIKKIRHH